MARPLRIEFPGAIYHMMARGNARQRIFREGRDYQRFMGGLEATHRDEVPQARRLGSLPLDEVLEATARLFDVDQAAFAQPRSAVLARDIAAWMARRWICATLRELAAPFGLTHPASVANLTRRAERAMQQRPRLRRQVESLRKTLLGAHQPT